MSLLPYEGEQTERSLRNNVKIKDDFAISYGTKIISIFREIFFHDNKTPRPDFRGCQRSAPRFLINPI